jgi:ketosteroid isomerase-like protein
MSQENVELVMRIYEAFNRGDGATVVEAADPAVSIEDYGVLDGKSYQGRHGVWEFIAFQAESFRGQRADLQDVTEAEDTLVVVVRLSAEGVSSGVPVATEFTHAWEFRDGKVSRLRIFRSKTEALEAVGLSE